MRNALLNIKAAVLITMATPVVAVMLVWTLIRMVWNTAMMMHDAAVDAFNERMS